MPPGDSGTHYANGEPTMILFYNKSEDKLEIKTDKRTTLSLYVYEKAGVFAYSKSVAAGKTVLRRNDRRRRFLKSAACFILPIIILPVLCLPICRGWTEPVMCVSMWRIIRKSPFVIGLYLYSRSGNGSESVAGKGRFGFYVLL